MARVSAESIEQITEFAGSIRRRVGPPPAATLGLVLLPDRVNELARSLVSEAGGADESIPSLVDGLAVILASRPVFLVNESRIWIESPYLSLAAGPARRPLESILVEMSGAVGRVGVRFNNRREWLGSGWLVAPDLIVTSRHVAEVFAASNGAEFQFRSGGHAIFRQIPYVNFAATPSTQDVGARTDIERILYVARDGQPDLAILRLKRPHPAADPIPLSSDTNLRDRPAFLLGYPARDPRESVANLADRVFEDLYERKCLAVGTLLGERNGKLLHDCLQLGDFSGAALLDGWDGRAVGLHIDGRFLHEGYAVAAHAISELLRDTPWQSPVALKESTATGGSLPAQEAIPPAAAAPAAFKEVPVRVTSVSPLREPPRRVLNANFRGPDGKMLPARSPLLAGREHTLLVDIGPMWIPELGQSSIVTGEKGFREDLLPAEVVGWPIEVVLLSDDFGPRQSSAWMWVRRDGGQSHPLKNTTSAPDRMTQPDSSVAAGPVELRINIPAFPEKSQDNLRVAHGRLCLYYRNNLLQSALVRVAVARDETVRSSRNNVVEVDFVLSSGLVALDERYAQRQVRFGRDEPRGHGVGLNLTLNDDGAGGHRIIVKRNGDTPLVGWSRFDPAAAQKFLGGARGDLLDCFFQRDTNCEVVRDKQNLPLKGLDARNGKTHEQFRFDLTRLAEIGYELFNKAFGQVVTESTSGLTPAAWMAALRKALGDGEVIQVARTLSMPDHYVFPWGLVYEYPLTGPGRDAYKWCRVLREWSPDGIRLQPPDRRCPFSDEPWHQENILCPYGFWGLKHIIEQPPSATWLDQGQITHGDTYSEIPMTDAIAISVALTRDQQLDGAAIGSHLNTVSHVAGTRLVPTSAAEDFDTVRAMLRAPQLAYFLCHCERDAAHKAFLSVGPRDGQPQHRIYADTLTAWSSSAIAAAGFDRPMWEKNRPLVFINGCHTADLLPGDLLNFVSPFTGAGASGVVGTEISVQLPVAIEFAEQLFTRITQPVTPGDGRCIPLGEAMREARWHFANKGNLLGLAYTFYSLANLQFVATKAPGA